MTADPTAPKIDTTRKNAERIMWRIHESKAGHAVRTEAFLLIEALLAERDLAAAQTAAAVREMREALTGVIALYNDDEGCRSLPQYLAAKAALDTIPDATALNRLLEAARQDERTAIAAYIGMSPSEVTDRQYHMEAIRTGRYRDDPLMQSGGWMEGGDG